MPVDPSPGILPAGPPRSLSTHDRRRFMRGSRGNEIRAARVSSRENPSLSLVVANLTTDEIRPNPRPFEALLRRVASVA